MAAKVLMITRACRPDAGGMERFSWELVYELTRDKKLSVTALAHRGSRRTSPLFVFTVIPRALMAAGQSDVIHLGDPILSLVGWLIKIILRKPVAVTVHGLDISYPNVLYQLYLKLFFRAFDLYLPISAHVASLLTARGIIGQNNVINPNTADRYYDPRLTRADLQRVLASQLSLQPDTRVLLTVGRLVKRKGHAWFVSEVLTKLPKSCIYLIAGNGPEREHIAQTAAAHGVAHRVFLLNQVSDTDLQILYNTVDAFVLPNLKITNDVEGFGLVLLEAALCQRLVLAANTDGIPDAIHHGQNGWLIPAADAAAWQAALRTLTPPPGARAYTQQQYVWPQAAKKYRQALLSLATRQTTVSKP